ncbi:hypothetical protein DD238_003777 [Peronospora effusa]|uniref:Reverse transcriptase Ty1/copia-type domain-containing protein n=1 Tax=Peronospora effusa TaxID=542832 RepID=A0A3M6VR68_9STRA|nr:hypothetical protein DD238_003777 [Peronospora effusa]
MNRTLVEMARSMIYHMEVDRSWWGEAIMAAAYTINRISNTARPNVSPFETLYGSKPDLSHFRVFGSTGYLLVADCKRTKWDSKAISVLFSGIRKIQKRTECGILREDNWLRLGEPFAQCNHYYDDLDEVKVEVPDLNKNNEDDEMDVDETADNDTSWEDMIVDASGDLNQSQNLDVVPIEGDRTDIQVIDTNNSMIRRTSHGSVAGSSNNGPHMLSGIPDQSQAIIVCENSRAPDDRMEIYSGSNKRPYSTFTSSRLLTNDDFDDERIDLPLLTDGSPVDGENDEPDPKRQCSQFIMKVVSKFKQNEAYAVRNPICAGQDLTPDESHPVVRDITSYRKLVGSLLYIANSTRPDISYAMSVLLQYLAFYTISWEQNRTELNITNRTTKR